MAPDPARLVAAAGAALLVATAAVGTIAQQATGSPTTLDGLTVTGTIGAPPLAVWHTQVTPRGVCGLIPGCTGARGTADTWQLSVTDGSSTHEVTARVTRRVPGRALDLALVADSPAGSLDGELRVDLSAQRRGTATTLRVTIVSLAATGLTAAIVPDVAEYLQDVMDAHVARVDLLRRQSGASLDMTVRAPRRGGLAVSAVVRSDALTAVQPRPSGRVIVTARGSGRPSCTTRIRSDGTASCRIRLPRATTRLRVTAVAAGSFSDGSPLMVQATRRWAR